MSGFHKSKGEGRKRSAPESGAGASRQARCHGIVELDGDDKNDAPVGAENAQQSPQSIQGLADEDAASDRNRDLPRKIGLDESFVNGAGPTGLQGAADDDDVHPVDEQSNTVMGELREQGGRKGDQRDDAEKGNVDP